MGLIPVRAEEVATIVTALEMCRRPAPRPLPDAPLRLLPWPQPDLAKYRALFRRVGEPWLWFSRLVMDDERLRAIVHDPAISVYTAVDRHGVEVGMLELDHRHPGECELSYFALVPELVGCGLGRWLMAHALMLGWRKGVERMWVHTCTLDHPRALGFYRQSGFVPFKRTVETFADPRASGILSPEAAPHYPRLPAA